MKKYTTLLFLIVLFGCKKNTTDQSQENNTTYYVKYVIDGMSSIQQTNSTGLKITLTDEKNTSVDYIRSNRGSNEFIIGPVKKGFKSSITGTNVCCPLCCYIRPNVQIYVSESNGPFVLKKEDMSTQLRDNVQIDYTIL